MGRGGGGAGLERPTGVHLLAPTPSSHYLTSLSSYLPSTSPHLIIIYIFIQSFPTPHTSLYAYSRVTHQRQGKASAKESQDPEGEDEQPGLLQPPAPGLWPAAGGVPARLPATATSSVRPSHGRAPSAPAGLLPAPAAADAVPPAATAAAAGPTSRRWRRRRRAEAEGLSGGVSRHVVLLLSLRWGV